MSFPDWRVKEQQRIQAAIDARDGEDNGVNVRAKARRAAREAATAARHEETGHDRDAAQKSMMRRVGRETTLKLMGVEPARPAGKKSAKQGRRLRRGRR